MDKNKVLMGSVELKGLIENDDGTYSPVDAKTICFEVDQVNGLGQVFLIVGDERYAVTGEMASPDTALDYLDHLIRL